VCSPVNWLLAGCWPVTCPPEVPAEAATERTGGLVPARSAGILNWGGSASVSSVSCGSAGNCVAGGSYRDRSGRTQAFVVDQTDGTWGSAIEVPGSEALNVRGFAIVGSVSCCAANNCTAGGFYLDGSDHEQVFVVRETNGTWGNAVEIWFGSTERGRGCPSHIGVVRLSGQLRRRRVLHGWLRSHPGVRGQPGLGRLVRAVTGARLPADLSHFAVVGRARPELVWRVGSHRPHPKRCAANCR
jgi:hypothetical protein